MLEKEYQTISNAINSISSYMLQIKKGKKVAEIKKTLDNAQNSPTTVLVCGEFKRGKSTFVNALIGRSVCPTDTDICTSVVSIIKFGNNEKVTRLYGDFSNLKSQVIDFDDIEKYTVGTAEDIDNTVCLEIELPLEELKKGLIIIDTPGVGGLDPRHAALTNYFLPQADVTLFMTDVNEPLTTTELDFYKNKVLQYAKHSAIIVNKADLKDADSVEEIRLDTLSKVSSYTQTPIDSIDIISVSAADSIREEEGLGNFPKLRNLINNLVEDFKREIIIGLRDDLSEQIEFAITPLQAQLDHIESPNVNQIQDLSNKKNEINQKLQEIADPQSSFRMRVNEKIAEEREGIIMALNQECIVFSTDGFNALLKDTRATSENGGKWLGEKINEKMDALGSEVTLMLNKAFEKISKFDEFDGMLHFKAKKYNGQIVVKDVDLSVPVHKRVLSSTPGWGIAMMGLCILGTGGLGLAASLLAGGYVATRNTIDMATGVQEGRLRQTYQSQIQTETQNLRIYVESRFTEFQREWLRAISERVQDYRDSLNQAMTEIQNLRQQINTAVNKKVAIENQLKPLKSAKDQIDQLDL